MNNFKYELYSKKGKFICPECKNRTFVKYIDRTTSDFLERKYGRCDREQNCGYWVKPENNKIISEPEIVVEMDKKDPSLYDGVFLDDKQFIDGQISIKNFKDNQFFVSDLSQINRGLVYAGDFDDTIHLYRDNDTEFDYFKFKNIFLRGLVKRFGKKRVKEVFDLYGLMTFIDGGVIFPYFDPNGRLFTGKIMFYDDNLKRIKKGPKSYINWLHFCKYEGKLLSYKEFLDDYKPDIGFFGYNYDIIDSFENKNIGIVESEKTAIILSIVIPEVYWLATGGISNLQKYKFMDFYEKNVFLLPDLGIIKSKNITIGEHWFNVVNNVSELNANGLDCKLIDIIPETLFSGKEIQIATERGLDAADFILGNRGKEYVEILRKRVLENI